MDFHLKFVCGCIGAATVRDIGDAYIRCNRSTPSAAGAHVFFFFLFVTELSEKNINDAGAPKPPLDADESFTPSSSQPSPAHRLDRRLCEGMGGRTMGTLLGGAACAHFSLAPLFLWDTSVEYKLMEVPWEAPAWFMPRQRKLKRMEKPTGKNSGRHPPFGSGWRSLYWSTWGGGQWSGTGYRATPAGRYRGDASLEWNIYGCVSKLQLTDQHCEKRSGEALSGLRVCVDRCDCVYIFRKCLVVKATCLCGDFDMC